VQRRWSRIFAIASTVTPLLLGTVLGAIATGAVSDPVLSTSNSFADAYVRPWLQPFPLAVGILALALFAFLAAVYLTVEATEEVLRDDFRYRALWAAAAVVGIASFVLLLARSGAPLVWSALTRGTLALGLRIAAALVSLAAVVALWRRSYRAARISAIIEVSLIVWGWALAEFPYLVPPDLTVENSAAPEATLRLLLWALLAGLALLIPSLRYLFKVFKQVSQSNDGDR
jgi:cytochrome d ubiquinol oxidase subunit II